MLDTSLLFKNSCLHLNSIFFYKLDYSYDEFENRFSIFISEFLEMVFETAHVLFPGSSYVTVLEEGLLLAPDFLAYSASVLPLLHDPTIIAVSAWNANGMFMNQSLMYLLSPTLRLLFSYFTLHVIYSFFLFKPVHLYSFGEIVLCADD